MGTNRRTHIREARNPERVKATKVSPDGEDLPGDITDHVISEEHPDEEKRLIPAERKINVSQETLRNVIVGIYEFFEDTVTALAT